MRRQLEARGLEYRVDLTHSLEHARALAREAAACGEVAVGYGGDGVVGAVAGALVGTDGLLGVVPGGRGNDFARTLGVSSLEVACDALAHGKPRWIDLGRVGGRTFVGIASAGFDSDANRIANSSRWIRGTLVYAYGALRALASWTPASFEVSIDGQGARRFTGYSVAAANSRAYGGGMMLAPGAALDDGCLDIVTIADVPRLRFLRLLPSVFSGRHVRKAFVQIQQGTVVEISADRPFILYADGDPIAQLPVRIEALPRAIRVLAPLES